MCTCYLLDLVTYFYFHKEEDLRYKAREGNKHEVVRLLKNKANNVNAVDLVSIVCMAMSCMYLRIWIHIVSLIQCMYVCYVYACM